MKANILSVAIVAALLTGCGGSDKDQYVPPEDSVVPIVPLDPSTPAPIQWGTDYTFDMSQPAVAHTEDGVNHYYNKIDVVWTDIAFEELYCTEDGDLCDDESEVLNFCVESEVAEDGCQIVEAGITGNRKIIDVSDIHFGSNPQFFIRAVYSHGEYDSNKFGLTGEQGNKMTQVALGDIAVATSGQGVVISGDGTTIVERNGGSVNGALVRIYKSDQEGIYSYVTDFDEATTDYNYTLGQSMDISHDGSVIVATESGFQECDDSDLGNPVQACASKAGAVHIYEMDSDGTYVRSLIVPDKSIETGSDQVVKLSSDGNTVVLASIIASEFHIRVYQRGSSDWAEITHYNETVYSSGHPLGALEVNSDGSTIALAQGDMFVIIYDFDGTEITPNYTIANPDVTSATEIESLAISGDNSTLVIGTPSAQPDGHPDTGGASVYKMQNGRYVFVSELASANSGTGFKFGGTVKTNFDGSLVMASESGTKWSTESGTQIYDNPIAESRHNDEVGSVSTFEIGEDGTYSFKGYTVPKADMNYATGYANSGNGKSFDVSSNGTMVVGAPLLEDAARILTGGFIVH
ncbi:hypothetical protein [Vibrio crassostreae]|uniref:hypothetical protein n=1 Tax=Vibrio crassostreae TaxID=246167 RepID=UPI001B3032E1|nr:hypothetical protein [Vibrio crassostreae]